MDARLITGLADLTMGIGAVTIGTGTAVAAWKRQKVPSASMVAALLVLAVAAENFASHRSGDVATIFYWLSAVIVGIAMGLFIARFARRPHAQ